MGRVKLLAAGLVALLSASAAGAETAYVEGYVFNKLTGVPVTSASVSITGGILSTGTIGAPPIVLTLGRPALTDGNGFYSIEVDLDQVDAASRSLADLQAACLTPAGLKSTNRWATRVGLRPGTVRRDLYIEGLPLRRVATHCQVRLDPAVRSAR